MKLDQTILQAGILAIIGGLSIAAAAQGNWALVGTALTGLFAALNLSRPKPPEGPQDPTQPPPAA